MGGERPTSHPENHPRNSPRSSLLIASILLIVSYAFPPLAGIYLSLSIEIIRVSPSPYLLDEPFLRLSPPRQREHGYYAPTKISFNSIFPDILHNSWKFCRRLFWQKPDYRPSGFFVSASASFWLFLIFCPFMRGLRDLHWNGFLVQIVYIEIIINRKVLGVDFLMLNVNNLFQVRKIWSKDF